MGGKLAVGSDNKTYTSLGYANGRGALRGPRPDLRGVDTSHKDYRQQATVLRRSETHGTEDVGKKQIICLFCYFLISWKDFKGQYFVLFQGFTRTGLEPTCFVACLNSSMFFMCWITRYV